MKDIRTCSTQTSSWKQKYEVGKRLQHLNASEALLELQKVSQNQPHTVFSDLIGFISRQDLMVLSYELIKSKPANTTKGSHNTTLDGFSLKAIDNYCNALKKGQFDFKPAPMVQIPKPGRSELRPLTIASPREKGVQKAIQLTLNAIFEPHFSPNSHGFRPNKSCHTALKQSVVLLRGVKWVVEADISKCFDTINHKRLIQTLALKINCTKTLSLIQRALKAGHVWQGKLSPTAQGTPQGSILSPLLCNIFLDQLDQYLEHQSTAYHQGKNRAVNPRYDKLRKTLSKLYALPYTKQKIQAIRQNRKIRQATHSGDPMDPKFRRMTWCRYADDFYIGIIGPKSEALSIRDQVGGYLNSIGLQLSEAKTTLTHFPRNTIEFLGASLQGRKTDGKYMRTKHGRKHRIHMEICLKAPMLQIYQRLQTRGMFKKPAMGSNQHRPCGMKAMVNLHIPHIITYYNSVSRGLLNYYSFVNQNYFMVVKLVYGLKVSCALTLALKLKQRTRAKIYAKFGKNLHYSWKNSKGKEVSTSFFLPPNYRVMPKHKRFNTTTNVSPPNFNKIWANKLTKSNMYETCVVCGQKPVQMHHVRNIRSIRSKLKTNNDFARTQMEAINRKQVPLCETHHHKVHGKLGGLNLEERLSFEQGC